MALSVIRRYPVAHAQRGLWFLDGLAPESAAYNVMSTWRIRSRVDVGALEQAWPAWPNGTIRSGPPIEFWTERSWPRCTIVATVSCGWTPAGGLPRS